VVGLGLCVKSAQYPLHGKGHDRCGTCHGLCLVVLLDVRF
jgi:hypothetical protein